MIAGDQYVADVLPARMFRGEFARRGLAPQVLSRAVEDSGTVTSVLVPWNTCGAYISGVLGVSTAAYFPFCFFNLLSPCWTSSTGSSASRCPQADGPWDDVEPAATATPETGSARGEETQMSDQTTTEADAREAAAVHAALGVHDPVRPDRADGDRDLAHPGGRLRARQGGGADPRHLPRGQVGHPQRILIDSLTAPINGLYGIENAKGNINYYNSGDAVRRDRRGAVHHRDRRLPRRDDGDRRDPGGIGRW